MCLATEKGCYRYNLSQSVCTFFTLQVSTLPAVDWATPCLGQILRIGFLGSQNIQFANPVGCAGWCNSLRKLRWKGASSTHATKLSENLGMKCCMQKGSTGQTPKCQCMQPEKSCDHQPPASRICKTICRFNVDVNLYICCSCEPSTMNTMQMLYVSRIQEVSRSRNGI